MTREMMMMIPKFYSLTRSNPTSKTAQNIMVVRAPMLILIDFFPDDERIYLFYKRKRQNNKTKVRTKQTSVRADAGVPMGWIFNEQRHSEYETFRAYR